MIFKEYTYKEQGQSHRVLADKTIRVKMNDN